MGGWNGAGVFSVTYDDFVPGTTILSGRVDQNNTDIVSGLNNVLTRDGQNSPSQNLPMNSKKHTGVLTTSGGATGEYLARDYWLTQQGWVLIDSETASASAALDFTTGINSTYSTYALVFQDLIPATQANLWLRFSVNGGSSFLAADYQANQNFIEAGTGAFANTTGGTSVAQIAIGGEPGTATGESMAGIVYISNPASAANYKKAWGMTVYNRQAGGPSQSTRMSVFMGSYTGATTAVNAFRILADSVNLESGTVRLYGIL